MENAAYVSRITGKTHWSSVLTEVEDELPQDMDDESVYVPVPHKHDLDLGKALALEFAREHLPESYEQVRAFFGQRGAYGRFKDLLERHNQLQVWYKYEAAAVEGALREWSSENGVELKD